MKILNPSFQQAKSSYAQRSDRKSHDEIREQLATSDDIAGALGVAESLSGSEPALGAAPALQITAGK